jgi:hypothetical protein
MSGVQEFNHRVLVLGEYEHSKSQSPSQVSSDTKLRFSCKRAEQFLSQF